MEEGGNMETAICHWKLETQVVPHTPQATHYIPDTCTEIETNKLSSSSVYVQYVQYRYF